MEHVLGKYMISDKPMTEEEWARERATVIDAEPAFDDGREEKHLEALPKNQAGSNKRSIFRLDVASRRRVVVHGLLCSLPAFSISRSDRPLRPRARHPYTYELKPEGSRIG